jgi:hypothetical protein
MVALQVVALLVGMVFKMPVIALPEEMVLVVVPIVAFRVVVLLATVLAVILRMEVGF